jgi:hypothetical protein
VPLTAREFGARSIALLTLAVVAFLAVLAWQVREIFRAEMPGLRAVQAVVVAVPLFITGYAALYLILSQAQGGFTEQLTGPAHFTSQSLSSVPLVLGTSYRKAT